MALVGVRVECTVRLVNVGRIDQVHSRCVRFECPQNLDKLRVGVERPVRASGPAWRGPLCIARSEAPSDAYIDVL